MSFNPNYSEQSNAAEWERYYRDLEQYKIDLLIWQEYRRQRRRVFSGLVAGVLAISAFARVVVSIDDENVSSEDPNGCLEINYSLRGVDAVENAYESAVCKVVNYWQNHGYPQLGDIEVVQKACDSQGPSYCGMDNTVVAGSDEIEYLAYRIGVDLRTVAIAVAGHEVSHAIDDALDHYDFDDSQAEDRADCRAGVAMQGIDQYRNLVDPAVEVFWSIGDYDQQDIFGNPDYHGTPEERQDAFLIGVGYGEIGCTDVYGV